MTMIITSIMFISIIFIIINSSSSSSSSSMDNIISRVRMKGQGQGLLLGALLDPPDAASGQGACTD